MLDPHGQIYVNLEDKSTIARIDAHTMDITAQWPLAPCQAPTGLAIDVDEGPALRGLRQRHNGDRRKSPSGKLLASVPIGKRCDGVAFDPASGVAVSANGEGTLTIVKETAAGKFEAVQTVTTRPGARTVAFDEATPLLPAARRRRAKRRRRRLRVAGRRHGRSPQVAPAKRMAILRTEHLGREIEGKRILDDINLEDRRRRGRGHRRTERLRQIVAAAPVESA